MIDSKDAYRHYLERDKVALGRQKDRRPHIFGDEIWKFEILLRRVEYGLNCKKGLLSALILKFDKFRFHCLSVRLGFTIPPNVFQEGLAIVHYGTIVVHANARAGRNCRLQEGVTIGSTSGGHEAAVIGDNCYFASGAKVIGAVRIADDVAVGAGAVVTTDIAEAGTTWAGVPARKISDNASHASLCQALFQ
ncbi:MAG: serine acetyltransferase [Bacteroidales bacterium]|nr:serine acetyltransferase [Bacteroidales bacterium]MCM1414553.1 serine acetyltransferase [bacterium]MCM1422603.1 serine acetyltransferase [bacterium]